MITSITAPTAGVALKKLKSIVAQNEARGLKTVIFCEDRLTLAAERTVCAAVGGTFSTSVYTFSRFLSAEGGKCENLLTSQGSAMAIRHIIEQNRRSLTLFKKLSAADAAQDVYDTIALLYSSRVSPDDLSAASSPDALLEGKLRDLELIYRAYAAYLEESGSVDRNRYMAMLPQVILSSPAVRGNEVIFLGFQAFTCSVAECASACMEAAKNVTGIFIGGSGAVYVNEASASFGGAAKPFGGANHSSLPSDLVPEAEMLRTHIFNPESFASCTPLSTSAVSLFEGADREEEQRYIAANIVRYVFEEGVRYRNISVMLPDIAGYEPVLARVFGEYGIPYYPDRRYSLGEHPVSSFLEGFLKCAADGCTKESVMSVVSSPMFVVGRERKEGERRKDKDLFCNYMLRLAGYRGGVKRTPRGEVLASLNFDISAVQRVREPFLEALGGIPSKGRGEQFCAALKNILQYFGCELTLAAMGEEFSSSYPSFAALSGRAYKAVCDVIDEAERLTRGMEMPVREFAKIFRSGLVAAQLSIIPPKQDAVFVGDLLKCANTGSEVVFVAGLTGDVPAAGDDTAILTDRDLASLDALNIKVSPKISQVNARSAETAGLNLCAFSRALHLCYPLGGDGGVSRIVDYARSLFRGPSGGGLVAQTNRSFTRNAANLKYICARPAPALRQLVSQPSPSVRSAIYSALCSAGWQTEAEAAVQPAAEVQKIAEGAKLYGTSFSPTVLESYFSCPYQCFMMKGLKLNEREEGVIRPLDSGNFIHAVLQKSINPSLDLSADEQSFVQSAREVATGLINSPQYSSLLADKRGEYTANGLVEEAVGVCRAAFIQLRNSAFNVSEVEKPCRITLDGGTGLYGRIDRVDVSGDMVRVIDYKTGEIDSSATLYYMGLKLQLPIYLNAAARGKRAVGAYYFPARIVYESSHSGFFRMKGFMDGSEEVVRSSDTTLTEGQSSYVDAALGPKGTESSLPREDFEAFIAYSNLIARRGAAEMSGGNVRPSPAEGACKFCKLAGSCTFEEGVNGSARTMGKVSARTVAGIVKKERGDI